MDTPEMGSEVVCSGPYLIFVFTLAMRALKAIAFRTFIRMHTPLVPLKVVWCAETLGSAATGHITGERLCVPLPVFSKAAY